MSRDCVQGSKCYNCSGVVSLDLTPPQCFIDQTKFACDLHRATSAGIVPNLKGGHATTVVQKGKLSPPVYEGVWLILSPHPAIFLVIVQDLTARKLPKLSLLFVVRPYRRYCDDINPLSFSIVYRFSIFFS